MNQLQLDDLRRAAERAGRGEMVMVDADTVLALLRVGIDEWYKGYEEGYKHGAEDRFAGDNCSDCWTHRDEGHAADCPKLNR